MTIRPRITALAAGAALVAGLTIAGTEVAGASTSCAALPTSFGYTEFSLGTVNESSGDSDGPTAYGGVSMLGNFDVAKNYTAGGTTFVAGGTVTGSPAGTAVLDYGNGYADANVTGLTVKAANGATLTQVSQSSLPVNFTAAGSQDRTLSSQLAALPTTAGDLSATTSGTLTLTATGSPSDGQYVWDLPVGQLTGSSTVANIKVSGVPTGSTIVVNVPDTGTVTLANTVTVWIDGVSTSGTGTTVPLASSTIFNFSGAGVLGITGTWAGAIFAPGAAVTFSAGHVYGSVVGATLSGTNESTYGPVESAACFDLSPTTLLPDGRPLYFGAAGAAVLGAAGVVSRRRSRRLPRQLAV